MSSLVIRSLQIYVISMAIILSSKQPEHLSLSNCDIIYTGVFYLSTHLLKYRHDVVSFRDMLKRTEKDLQIVTLFIYTS